MITEMLIGIICLFSFQSLASSSSVEQVHIALAGGSTSSGDSPNGMRVTWFSADEAPLPHVMYGITSNISQMISVSNASTQQYLKKHGYHHTATIRELNLSTFYYYVACNDVNDCSDVFRFRSAPDSHATIKVSIFGDMGYEDSEKRPMKVATGGLVKDWSATYTRKTLEKLKNNNEIDMVWHVGDIGYADDTLGHEPLSFAYEDAYNGYMNWMQNVTSSLPYMVAVGNHESECHSPRCLLENKEYGQPLRNFSAYNTRWHMPSAECGARANSAMWYSFNYGQVHFVSINTETDFPGAGEEKTGDSHDPKLPAGSFGREGEYLAWLEEDLKTANKARQDGNGRAWIIAGGHRPYREIEECCGELFDKYNVDLYFAGHSHSYSRSLPASKQGIETHHKRDTYVSPNSTAWVVVGGAGCDEMAQGTKHIHSQTEIDNSPNNGYHSPKGSMVVSSARYATGVLEANSTALSWRLIDSADGSILDSFVIKK